MLDWISVKKLILDEMYKGVLKLESFNILDISENVVSKVASTIVATKKIGIRVKWLNRVIAESDARRDHFELLLEARLLRIQLENFKKRWIKQAEAC